MDWIVSVTYLITSNEQELYTERREEEGAHILLRQVKERYKLLKTTRMSPRPMLAKEYLKSYQEVLELLWIPY